ncbi:MAG: hypothetical protein KGI27_13105 [Thaumarchaeota archaeon]|nr:hypothetical protein [Nitrososphaerota archaeon]
MDANTDQIFKNKKEKNLDALLSKLTPLFKSGVEYVGVINEQGRFVDAIYKKTLNVPAGQLEMFFMGARLQCSMQKDFDDALGRLSYVLIQREDLRILSVPILSFIVIVVTRTKSNHHKIIEKIINAAHNLVNQEGVQEDGCQEH